MAKYPSEEKEEKTYRQSAEKKFRVRFNENRSFELHLGRSVIIFAPYGEQELNEDQMKALDLDNVRRLFTVKEA